MPQFDVHHGPEGTLLLDCQADALGAIATRIVVPLVPLPDSPARRERLNPLLDVNGEQLVMLTQFVSAVRSAELRTRVANLGKQRLTIVSAFDMLLTGV